MASPKSPFLRQLDRELSRTRNKLLLVIGSRAPRAFRRSAYKEYLRQLYHHAWAVERAMEAAVPRLPEGPLKEYFGRHIQEETNHDLLALKDLLALGETEEAVRGSSPNPGCAALMGYSRWVAVHENPAAVLGELYVGEGLAMLMAGHMAKVMKALRTPENALGFLRCHGTEDVEHMREMREVLERDVTDPKDQADILQTARVSGELLVLMHQDLFRRKAGN